MLLVDGAFLPVLAKDFPAFMGASYDMQVNLTMSRLMEVMRLDKHYFLS